MKQIFLLLIACGLLSLTTFSQVGIGTTTPDGSAMLDVSATNKGMLVPRMTTAQRTAIATPATGLMVFDTDNNSFWFFDGIAWKSISVPINFRYFASTSQSINANTNTKVNFDSQSFLNNASFSNNTFTVPVSGIYNFGIYLSIYGNNAGSLSISILANNVSKTAISYNVVFGVFQAMGFSDNIVLSAGDLVTVQVNASAAMAIVFGQGTFFTAFKIN